MRDDQLKKLRRGEMLELLLAQTKEINRLKEELATLQGKYEEKTIAIEECGSIAEASLKIHKVFEDAQAAATLYLDNIDRLKAETKREVEAQVKAEMNELIEKTRKECDAYKEETKRDCNELMQKTISYCKKLKAKADAGEDVLAELEDDE